MAHFDEAAGVLVWRTEWEAMLGVADVCRAVVRAGGVVFGDLDGPVGVWVPYVDDDAAAADVAQGGHGK